eukprot:TRINITY_DN67805_c8_g2_i1.p1 TRINITY_DN67805_c8_g2~~TRINITY_DN67805_c8_g2_i1.p1  ORF type:complete len:845 (+),score=500.70 TRINITY_DN67805_c8_g2_i1:145-2679(+)
MSATARSNASYESSASISTGDHVWIPALEIKGRVRYAGTVHFAKGNWLGLELSTPDGKNDGSVKGRRYFVCKKDMGLFVRPKDCERISKPKIKSSSSRSLLRKKGSNSTLSSSNLKDANSLQSNTAHADLFPAVKDTGNIAFLKLLVNEDGVDVRGTDKFDNTALHVLALMGGGAKTVKVLEFLLEKGLHPHIHHKNSYGQTAAMVAALNRNWAVLRFLIENGADTISKGPKDNQKSVWEHCHGKPEGVKAMHEGLVEQARRRRAGMLKKIPIMVHEESTLVHSLFEAARWGDLAYVRMLLEEGHAPVNITDRGGRNVTHIIARDSKRLNILKYLVAQGADFRLVDQIGDTPAHIGARAKAWANVEYLVGVGASVTHKDSKNKSVYEYCQVNADGKRTLNAGLETFNRTGGVPPPAGSAAAGGRRAMTSRKPHSPTGSTASKARSIQSKRSTKSRKKKKSSKKSRQNATIGARPSQNNGSSSGLNGKKKKKQGSSKTLTNKGRYSTDSEETDVGVAEAAAAAATANTRGVLKSGGSNNSINNNNHNNNNNNNNNDRNTMSPSSSTSSLSHQHSGGKLNGTSNASGSNQAVLHENIDEQPDDAKSNANQDGSATTLTGQLFGKKSDPDKGKDVTIELGDEMIVLHYGKGPWYNRKQLRVEYPINPRFTIKATDAQTVHVTLDEDGPTRVVISECDADAVQRQLYRAMFEKHSREFRIKIAQFQALCDGNDKAAGGRGGGSDDEDDAGLEDQQRISRRGQFLWKALKRTALVLGERSEQALSAERSAPKEMAERWRKELGELKVYYSEAKTHLQRVKQLVDEHGAGKGGGIDERVSDIINNRYLTH